MAKRSARRRRELRKNSLVLFFYSLFSFGCYADKVTIEEIRVWSDPEKTRFVFDLSGAPDYRAFLVSNPDRYVVDIKNSDFESLSAKFYDRIKNIKIKNCIINSDTIEIRIRSI